MPRKLIGGLIQAAVPIADPAAPPDRVRKAAFDAHIPLIEDASLTGVHILGLHGVFNSPRFCRSQGRHWYDTVKAMLDPAMDWQCYRNRRPETDLSMAEQLP